MGRDKKAVAGPTFVSDKGPAGIEVVPGVPEPAMRAALTELDRRA